MFLDICAHSLFSSPSHSLYSLFHLHFPGKISLCLFSLIFFLLSMTRVSPFCSSPWSDKQFICLSLSLSLRGITGTNKGQELTETGQHRFPRTHTPSLFLPSPSSSISYSPHFLPFSFTLNLLQKCSTQASNFPKVPFFFFNGFLIHTHLWTKQ